MKHIVFVCLLALSLNVDAQVILLNQAALAPGIGNISSGTPSSSATITFTTTENANCGVAYGTSSGVYSATNSEVSPGGLSHSTTINSLSGSLYYFRVNATNAIAPSAWITSAEQTFAVSFGGYYLDAITGIGSDSANGVTATTPWATLAHAGSVLIPNTNNLLIRYPDGIYRSSPPVWTGFLSYYPHLMGTFAGASKTTVYDVYNGHHGIIGDVTGQGIQWQWNNFATPNELWWSGSPNNVAYGVSNFNVFGPTTAGAFIVAQSNSTAIANPFYAGVPGGNPRIALLSPYTDGTVYFDFGSFTGGRISFVPGSLLGQIHVWGALAGNNYQALYMDGTREAFQNSCIAFSPPTPTTLLVGFDGILNDNYGTMYSLMVSATALSDANYLILNTWITNTELSRLHAYAKVTPANGLELTPAMGWDSWRPYGQTATEAEIKANAAAMVADGLASAGYKYVTPNCCWTTSRASGHLVPTAGFPSGMASLGSYIHGLGLKYGFYAGAGTTGCDGAATSGGYEAVDAADFAAFGIDKLMYDSCTEFGSPLVAQTAFLTMYNALQAAGLNIPYLTSCPVFGFYGSVYWSATVGGNEAFSALDQGAFGALTWSSLLAVLDSQYGLDGLVTPGHWNLPDILEVGNGNITDTEGQSNFSLWAILAAPLEIGINLTVPPSNNTFLTLTNMDVIAVDQDSLGICGKRVSQVAQGGANVEVYARQLQGGSWAVVLFNRASTAQSITANWSMFCSSPSTFTNCRDLWAHTNLGSLTGGYSTTVASHGVAMLKLTP